MNQWEGWPQEEALRNLLLAYFLNFTRLEFAMKAGGFGAIQYGVYQPSWRAFKEEMRGQPLPDDLKAAHQYLWDHPPNLITGIPIRA